MINIKDKTVADLVSDNIKTANVFKKHGIDFCCGGRISIEKACEKKGLDYATVVSELFQVRVVKSEIEDYNNWDLDKLIDYIIKVHHSYVLEAIPLIIQYSDKVAKVHGHHYEEVVKINELFHTVAEELLQHMQKEEKILFPYILDLVKADNDDLILSSAPFGSVQNPIQMMNKEHETAGNILKEISNLANSYTPPDEACNTFRALYASLEEFEQDLHLHIHLENNILFPKSIALESKMIKA